LALTSQLVNQCQIYSWLEPILSGVKPPPDVDVDSPCVSYDLCKFYPNTCRTPLDQIATCGTKSRMGIKTVALTCSKLTGEYVRPLPQKDAAAANHSGIDR
jgi:hypothetical protein